jgi:hypothetical protein
VIYCVVPRELADELLDKLVARYQDNPEVTVILDRRWGDDRRGSTTFGGQRTVRDRRRRRVPGTLLNTDPPDAA